MTEEVRDQIVFINQNSGYLMIDIINAHRRKYSHRAFITGRITARDIPLDDAVKIQKIIAYDRSSTLRRLFSWSLAFLQILVLVKSKYRRADLYIVSNPPFATLLPLFCRNRFFILAFDVYPDALVEYKILKPQSFIIRMWRRANMKIFSRAEKIFTLSAGMKELLAAHAAKEKIQVVPLWTDNTFLQPVRKQDNKFISENGLDGKFIVMYSGNLGYTHSLEVLIDLALKIKERDIIFIIIGEGDKKKLLEEKIRYHHLENCLLLPWQDVKMLPYSLAAADLAVVTLGKEASLLSVPSKTFNLMSVGAPLLCLASPESELAKLVDRYKIGEHFEPDQVEDMLAYIAKVKSDALFQAFLRERSLAASMDFTIDNAKQLVAC